MQAFTPRVAVLNENKFNHAKMVMSLMSAVAGNARPKSMHISCHPQRLRVMITAASQAHQPGQQSRCLVRLSTLDVANRPSCGQVGFHPKRRSSQGKRVQSCRDAYLLDVCRNGRPAPQVHNGLSGQLLLATSKILSALWASKDGKARHALQWETCSLSPWAYQTRNV